jgi:NhaA family Na+:H+ antiporter
MIVPALAVWAGIAIKARGVLVASAPGRRALAGIGFTMSLFIAGQAFASPDDFSAAKIAVFLASIVSAVAGVALLWRPLRVEAPEHDATGESAATYGHSELDAGASTRASTGAASRRPAMVRGEGSCLTPRVRRG